MKKLLILLGILTVLLAGSITAMASEPMWATLPDAEIDTNWASWKDEDAYKVKYPILEYNDTIYMPMTLCNCLDMGIAMSWYNETLYLSFAGNRSQTKNREYEIYDQPEKFKCSKPYYPIILNGETLLDSVDGMPILNYHGVTYLPLNDKVLRELHLELEWEEDRYRGTTILNINTISKGSEYRYDGIYKNEDGRIEYRLRQTVNIGLNWRDGYTVDNSFDGENVTNIGRYYWDYYVGAPHGDETPIVFPDIEPVDVTEQFRCENGFLMHGEKQLGEMPGTVVSALEYHLGDGVSVLSVNKRYRNYQCYFCANGAYVEIRNYVSPELYVYNSFSVSRIDFKWWRTDDGSVYFTDNDAWFFVITPDGQYSAITDEDHDYFMLVGLIDGRPLVKALWDGTLKVEGARKSGLISPVNDGFFIVEEDGSLKKYLDYQYHDYAFVMDNRLYLIDMYDYCFIDTVTGEKYPIDVDEIVYSLSATSSGSGNDSSGSGSSGITIGNISYYKTLSSDGANYNIWYEASCPNATDMTATLTQHSDQNFIESHSSSSNTITGTFGNIETGDYNIKIKAANSTGTKEKQYVFSVK